MAKQNISSTAKEMQEFNKASTELVAVLNDLAKALGDNAKAAEKFTGESAKNYKESFTEAVSLGKQLSGYTVDQLKNRQEETKFLKKVSQLEQEQARVQSKISFLKDKLVTATRAEQGYIIKSLKALREVDDTLSSQVQHANKLKTKFEEISKQSKVFDDLSDFFQEIPGVSKIFGEFQKASNAARDAAAEGKNGFAAGAKELSGALVKGLAALGLSYAIKGLKNADERITSIGRSLNVSREQSEKLVKNFNYIARSTKDLTGTEIQTAAAAYSDSLGSTVLPSMETSKELARQAKFLGISAEESAKQNTFVEATGGNLKDNADTIRGEVILSNARNKTGIDYKKIMKDVANASNASKLLMQAQGKSITAAAIEAKKLGANLEQISKIGASMLDFESSIANELEAELITGKELSNEKARVAALMGDQKTLSEEIKKNNVLETFANAKNVLAQESIAKAYGMSKEEMADMVVQSKALTAFGAKDKNELNDKVKLEMARIDKIENATEREKARAELTKKLGSDALEQQIKNQSLAEKQALANDRIVEAMDKLIPILTPIAKLFEMIANHANTIAKVLLMITGGALLGKLTTGLRVASTSLSATAQGLTKSATSPTGFRNAAGQFAKAPVEAAAASGGIGGFFKGIGSKIANSAAGKFIGNAATKLNPLKAAGSWVGKNAMKLLKLPVISSIIELFFAKGDIESMIQNATDKKTLYQQVGKRSWQALGSIGGAALGTLLPFPGLGTILGGMAGSWLAGTLADAIGSEGMGKFVVDNIFPSAKKDAPIALATGGITTGPTRALIGEAGREAVIPLTEFYAKIDELIAVVKQGNNIYIGPNKLNESIGLNLHSVG